MHKFCVAAVCFISFFPGLALCIRDDGKLVVKGNITIGGLFDLRATVRGQIDCSNGLLEDSVVSTVATTFAINKANSNLSTLGLSLGLEAFDSCDVPQIGLKEANRWVNMNRSDPERIWAVVGSLNSNMASPIGQFLQTADIPMISQFGSYDNLGGLNSSPMTIQLSYKNYLQARAILSLLIKMNWTSVILVFAEDLDSSTLAFDIRSLLSFREFQSICISYSMMLPLNGNDAETKRQIDVISDNRGVVLLLADIEGAEHFFNLLNGSDILRNYQFVASKSWSLSHITMANAPDATMGLIQSTRARPEFYRYIKENITLETSCNNPWLTELIGIHNKCQPSLCLMTLPNGQNKGQNCSGEETPMWDNTNFDTGYQAMLSIEILAGTITRLQELLCTTSDLSECRYRILNVDTPILINALRNSTDQCMPSGSMPQFAYVMFENTTREWEKVGTLDNTSDVLSANVTLTETMWKRLEKRSAMHKYCRSPCNDSMMYQRPTDKTCCWECNQCASDNVVVHNSSCAYCNDSGCKTVTCVKFSNGVLFIRDKSSIVQVALVGVGVILSIVVILLFVLNRESTLMVAISSTPTIAMAVLNAALYLTGIFYFLPEGHGQNTVCVGTTSVWSIVNAFVWSIAVYKMYYTGRHLGAPHMSSTSILKRRKSHWMAWAFALPTAIVSATTCVVYFVLRNDKSVGFYRYSDNRLWYTCTWKSDSVVLVTLIPYWALCIATMILSNRNRQLCQVWIFWFEAQLMYYSSIFTLVLNAVAAVIGCSAEDNGFGAILGLSSVVTGPSVLLLVYLGPLTYVLVSKHKRANVNGYLFRRHLFRKIYGTAVVMMTLEELQAYRGSARPNTISESEQHR